MINLEDKSCLKIVDCDKCLKAINLGKMTVERMKDYQRDICNKNSEGCYLN
ncbi:MAG: hypothetical protein KKF67_02450 [Nanoarchaeota archaeon]|nr:hypothetical protein [Nanoarchaeota archaeon]